MKKILIDINAVVPLYSRGRTSGIGRTTKELIKALDALKPTLPFEVTLYSQNMKGIGGRNLDVSFKNKHFYLPHRKKINRLFEICPVKELFAPYELMHIPHNFEYLFSPDKTVLTIHDAMFFAYPEDFLGHDFARKSYPKLAKAAKGIITCSNASKSDIVEFMGVNEEFVDVVHWGVDHKMFYPQNQIESSATLETLSIDFPYFLMVSCDIGRKNTEGLLRAFKKFNETNKNHRLVLVWGNMPDILQKEYGAELQSGKLIVLKNVSDQVLSVLYNQASLSFFPSKYEGFGLPILESMACGTPVVTCRNSSLQEIGGEAVIYVNPEKDEELRDWMEVFENGEHSKEKYFQASINRSAQFTWEAAAKKYVNIYKKHLEV